MTKYLVVLFLVFSVTLGQDVFSNIANGVSERASQLGETLSGAAQSVASDVSSQVSKLSGILPTVAVPTIGPVVIGVGDVTTLDEGFAAGGRSLIANLKDKEGLINSIKSFSSDPVLASIPATSAQSNSGRSEVNNYIVNSINGGSMTPGDLIRFASSKLDADEAGKYLQALGDKLTSAGF